MPSTGDGYRIEFDTAPLEKALKKFTKKGGKVKELLEQAGEIVERSTFERIGRKENVDGSSFAPLSPAYKKRKKKNKERILVETGRMVDSLAWDMASDNEVRVGFGDAKAKFHCDPDTPRSKIPLRNPLGVSDGDVKEIQQAAEDLLQF